jgi:hypothetical protein
VTPCKHLDYTEGEYTDCEIVTLTGFSCPVRYWRRGATWTDNGPHEPPNPSNVQFCGAGRGRINSIFACYNDGEMPCYEAADATAKGDQP